MRFIFHSMVVWCLLMPAFLFGADLRTTPVDMYIIFDGSAAIQGGRDGAVQWLCNNVVDTLLQEGDSLTIWTASEKVSERFSEVITGTGEKDSAKKVINALVSQGAYADYADALKEAASRQAKLGGNRIPYTLVINGSTTEIGSSGAVNGIRGTETMRYLRYSLVKEFSGWRAMTVGLGMEKRVQQAAAAYMKSDAVSSNE